MDLNYDSDDDVPGSLFSMLPRQLEGGKLWKMIFARSRIAQMNDEQQRLNSVMYNRQGARWRYQRSKNHWQLERMHPEAFRKWMIEQYTIRINMLSNEMANVDNALRRLQQKLNHEWRILDRHNLMD